MKIIDAVKKGNLNHGTIYGYNKELEVLIEQGEDINQVDDYNRTPLILATMMGDTDTVKFFLLSLLTKRTIDPNVQDKDGNTAIMYALINSNAVIVRMLLKFGVNLTLQNHNNETAYYLAVKHWEITRDPGPSRQEILGELSAELVVQQYITPRFVADVCTKEFSIEDAILYKRKGIAINALVTYGEYLQTVPLFIAISFSSLNAVIALLEIGANMNFIDAKASIGYENAFTVAAMANREDVIDELQKRGLKITNCIMITTTPLIEAVKKKNHKLAKKILSLGVVPGQIDRSGNPALIYAAENDDVEMITILKDGGAKIDVENHLGLTPLLAASKKGCLKSVTTLLSFKAKVNHTDKSGQTALHKASAGGHKAVVVKLLDSGANIDCCAARKITPLMLSSEQTVSEVTEELLRRKAKVDLIDQNDNTALLIAARSGRVDNVVLLLKYKANIDHVNKSKETALILAAKHNHGATGIVLLKNSANHNHIDSDRNNVLLCALISKCHELVPVILERKIDINHRNGVGLTALLIAADGGMLNSVKCILSYKFDKPRLEDTNSEGATALVISTIKGYEFIVAVLIDHKANIDFIYRGDTLLIIAIEHGHYRLAAFLIEKCNNLDHVNNNGRTALMYATMMRQYDLVRKLLAKNVSVCKSNHTGKTALSIAEADKDGEMIHILQQAVLKAGKEDTQSNHTFGPGKAITKPVVPSSTHIKSGESKVSSGMKPATTEDAVIISEQTTSKVQIVEIVLRQTAFQSLDSAELDAMRAQVQNALAIAAQTSASASDMERRIGLMMNSLSSRVDQHDEQLVHVFTKIAQLGSAYEFLMEKISAQEEYHTIQEALTGMGYHSARDFFDTFVGEMENAAIVMSMTKSGRFMFDYGRNGFVVDTLVALADLAPVPGVSLVTHGVRAMVKTWQSRAILQDARKNIIARGSIADVHKLATAIAACILKYNGQEIASCQQSDAEKLAKAAVKAVVKYTGAAKDSSDKVFVEDIAHSLLSGVGLEAESETIRARLVVITAQGTFKSSRYKPGTTIELNWLNDVMVAYAKKRTEGKAPAPVLFTPKDQGSGPSAGGLLLGNGQKPPTETAAASANRLSAT